MCICNHQWVRPGVLMMGTVRPIPLPPFFSKISESSMMAINGYMPLSMKPLHHSLFANLYGPGGERGKKKKRLLCCDLNIIIYSSFFFSFRKHDSGMPADSGIYDELASNSFEPAGHTLCLYGDPAYQRRVDLQAPFRNVLLPKHMVDLYDSMSAVYSSADCLLMTLSMILSFLN